MRSAGIKAVSSSPSTGKSQNGFTLLELLVIATIAATLVAVTIPGMSSALNAHWLKAGLRGAVGEIRVARSAAVTRNVRSRISVSEDGKRLSVEVDPSGTNAWIPTGTPFVLDGGVTVASVSPANGLVFTPRGTLSDAVTVTLRNGRGDTKNIVVGLIGSVDVS
jgi:Tfp pilus assembly protein FimT